MSRHEGVSCDSCLKGNFRGRRYKCLVCYDYDLCGACYDAGATTTRHTTEHPMQCILTRNDLELYYSGEVLEQQQSFTCPFCGKMGCTETTLLEHVAADHTVSTFEVVCPICAAQPGGEPNLITDDFLSHLSLEHRSGPRDLISFLDEPSGTRHPVRRIPHPTRGVGGSRNRNRSNMHFSSGNASSTSLSTRDSVDPIAELLSQLSGVRRNAGSNSSNTTQLAHLQMQLQIERQQVRAARQQLERLPRRQTQSSSSGANHASASSSSNNNAVGTSSNETNTTSGQKNQHVFLLPKSCTPNLTDKEKSKVDKDKVHRSFFLQELLLSSLMSGVTIGPISPIAHMLPQPRLPADFNINLGLHNTPSNVLAISNTPSNEMGVTNISIGENAVGNVKSNNNSNNNASIGVKNNSSSNQYLQFSSKTNSTSKVNTPTSSSQTSTNSKSTPTFLPSRTTLISIPGGVVPLTSSSTTVSNEMPHLTNSKPTTVVYRTNTAPTAYKPLTTNTNKTLPSNSLTSSNSNSSRPSSNQNRNNISTETTLDTRSNSSGTTTTTVAGIVFEKPPTIAIKVPSIQHGHNKPPNSIKVKVKNKSQPHQQRQQQSVEQNLHEEEEPPRLRGTGTIREVVARNRVNIAPVIPQRKIENRNIIRSNNTSQATTGSRQN